jgi:O-acetyl-ADP-ribose deacetylase (regulator of RNase III)
MNSNMNYFKNIQIHLIDINKEMTIAWEKFFSDIPNVKIHNIDLNSFLQSYPIEAIVSPANSFGIMSGGYDKAIIDCVGSEVMKDVQQAIKLKWFGEQPVGTSITVPIRKYRFTNDKNETKYTVLIHTPTMRTPEIIKDPKVVYSCMRSTLIEAKKQEVNSILIPAFGGCTGQVDKKEIANMMRLAYDQLTHIPEKINWYTIFRI